MTATNEGPVAGETRTGPGTAGTTTRFSIEHQNAAPETSQDRLFLGEAAAVGLAIKATGNLTAFRNALTEMKSELRRCGREGLALDVQHVGELCHLVAARFAAVIRRIEEGR